MPNVHDAAQISRRHVVSGLADPIGRYSHVTIAGSGLATAYISGQVGVNADGQIAGPDAESQTRAAFANIEAIVKDLGSTTSAILKMLTFVAGTEHLAGFIAGRDAVFDVWYPEGDSPAHSLALVAGLARADLVVEIEAVAGVAAP